MTVLTVTHICNYKANVVHNEDGSKTLISYDTEIATIKDGVCSLKNQEKISLTTSRHITEFCRLFNAKLPKYEIKRGIR